MNDGFDDCLTKFNSASKAYKRCRESNAFREMHGLPSIEGLDENPLPLAKAVIPATKAVPVITDVQNARTGGCGSCGGASRPIVAGSLPVVSPIPKIRSQKRPIKTAGNGVKKSTVLERAVRYAEALRRHLADDSSAALIEDVLFRRSCCGKCPFNVDDVCQLCECPLKKNLLNDGKLAWRSEQCPAGRWFRHNENRRPLVNPTRNLIFHLYPKLGAEWNWHWHIEQIREHASEFNGCISIGVVVGPETATIQEIRKQFEGIPVTNWVVEANNKSAESLTHVSLMRTVKTDDPNTITLRMHSKGVTKGKDRIEQKWKELLWETLTDWPSVEDALSSHLICGPLRSQEPLVKSLQAAGVFFFAGSGYVFRNKEAFERDWDRDDTSRWWVEYVPGHLFTLAESACLLHDFTQGSVLSEKLWKETIEPEWADWRKAREQRADPNFDQLPESFCDHEATGGAVLVPE